jgi:FkbM family methyltransferase
MKRNLSRLAAWGVGRTGLGLLPVRVRGGLAAGARWTLYPWTSYWRGTHEPRVQAAMLALGGGNIAGWSCWDLGAHFGLYSIGLARRVGPTGEVAAFEPNPVSFARLRRHARMNRLPWLKIHEAAVSDHTGSSEIYTYGDMGSTAAHLPNEGEPRQDACTPVGVRTLGLDELVASGRLRPPHFVKVDVEGHAHRALAGMAAALRKHRPLLIVALHSPEEEAGVLGLLRPLGYDFAPIEPAARPPWCGQDLLFTPRAPAHPSLTARRE